MVSKFCSLNPTSKATTPLPQASRVTEVKEQEEEVLQAQSYPLRNYLMKHVMPTLNQGLIEVCKVRPDDAIDYLVSNVRLYSIHRDRNWIIKLGSRWGIPYSRVSQVPT